MIPDNNYDFLQRKGDRAGALRAQGASKARAVPRFQRGQSLIEFAFVLIIILLLLAGTIDLGRAIFTYLALRDAAQEGASYASYNPTADITTRVCSSMDAQLAIDCTAGRITVQKTVTGPACSGNSVQVRVTYIGEDPFDPGLILVTPFLGTILGGRQHILISAWVSDTILSPPCT